MEPLLNVKKSAISGWRSIMDNLCLFGWLYAVNSEIPILVICFICAKD